MAEDFPATGICGGSWWSLPKNDHSGSFGSWLINDLADLKPKSCKLQQDSININSSLAFQDLQKPHRSSDSDHGGGFMDSSMGFGVSSSSDWTQTLLRGNLQEDLNLQVQKDWSPKSFSATSTQQDSSINTYKATNFSLEQQEIVNPLTNSGNSYVYQSSPLIQSLFEPSDDHRTAVSYSNSSPQNYGALLNQLSPSFLKPSISNRQSQISNGLNFSNNTTFWNNSPEFPPPNSQPPLILPSFGDKPSCPNLTSKPNNEAQVTKKVSEPALKRARIETPSPLPTFKVRKEKLGDRITALQQLVSPFGKTDTASVLHEAIEYIKFLHDQVNVLSTPYMKNGNPIQHQQVGEREVSKEDLKSRGLCLVPIASTFPVAHETTADFWTPTFGGSLSAAYQSNQDAIEDNFNTKRR